MICKDCGARLGARDTSCPRCGAPAPATEGGVGFWDMLDGPATPATQDPSASTTSEPSQRAAGAMGTALQGTVERVGLPVVVCCALSAACLLGTLIGGVVSMSATQSTRADLQKQVTALNDEVDSLKALVGDIRDAQSTMQLEVVRSPRNTTQAVGYDNAESKLFEVEVSGKVASFSWQKLQGETGLWEELSFDEESHYNSRYGLRFEEDLEAGTTALMAAGLAGDSAGTYRCVARGIYGDEVTCSATLLILPETEEAQSETVDPTTTGGTTYDETYESTGEDVSYGDEYVEQTVGDGTQDYAAVDESAL